MLTKIHGEEMERMNPHGAFEIEGDEAKVVLRPGCRTFQVLAWGSRFEIEIFVLTIRPHHHCHP